MEDKLAILETKCEEQERRLAALDAAVKLSTYIPSEVLSEIVAVLEFGDGKHPGDEWRRVMAGTHYHFALGHLHEAIGGYDKEKNLTYDMHDAETGKHHLSHAICRLMFALALVIESEWKP